MYVDDDNDDGSLKKGFSDNVRHVLKGAHWDAWVAQWLSVCLWLRAWSWGPGIKSYIGLLVGSLLLPLPMSLPLCLS